ncbi:MAG: glycosyltransferase [Cyanobacteria bacterium P01_D01_bin.156]
MLIDNSLEKEAKDSLRILVISVRGFRSQIANCSIYEFEDVLCELEGARLYAPNHEFEIPRRVYRLAKYATGSDHIARTIAPFPAEVLLEEDYDLLLAVLDNPWQIHLMEAIKNWQDRCRYTACFIQETWKPSFDDWRLAYEPFKNFDHIFSGTAHCVETLANAAGVPCEYLPPGVDTLKFCPYPNPVERNIDVCCVGRRLPQAHQSLFAKSQQDHSFFYYFDTIKSKSLEVDNAREHRTKLVSLLQRSRYNITAPAKFNSLKETGGAQEIGTRFFEGTAAGTVLIGMPPRGDLFPRCFDWEDAVIKVDVNQHDVVDVIHELNTHPDWIENISRNNIVNSLRKHDWSYRWRRILAPFDLQPSSAVIRREQYLRDLACTIESVDMPVAC